MIDSVLFRDVFSTAEMRDIFEDTTMIQNWLDIEVALAQVQAEMGIIPQWAAEEISAKARVENLDLDAIRKGMAKTGHSLVPTLRELQRHCDKGAGEFIHLGATTQDIIDTGFMISAKRAWDVVFRDLRAVEDALVALVDKHKDTVMAGRTHGQQALPITFGYKAAVWASEVRRHIERMKESRARVLVGQMSGAVGTMAGFGPQAMDMHDRVMARLGLGAPDISWHASRDRLVEIANILAMIAGTLGKIGNEVYSLQKTEVSELAEPFAMGMVGSSTMPHKRNPGASEGMNTLSKVVKANLMLMHEALFQEHERDGAFWKVEWIGMPEAFILTGAALAKAKHVIGGLVVNAEQMQKNLGILRGLLLSEAVMLELGEKLGKQTAHEVVYEISMKTFEQGGSFKEYLLEDERVRGHFDGEQLDRVLDPSRYTGLSRQLAERVVANIKAQQRSD